MSNESSIITCQKCGEPLEADWKECPACRTPTPSIELKCPKCGAPIEETWEVCPRCCTILPDSTVQEEQSETVEYYSQSSTTDGNASLAVREDENLQKLREAIAFETGTGRKKELFLELAELGNPLAKMWLAQCYHNGHGNFQKDVEKAEKIANEVIEQVRELAKQSNQEAAFLLGSAYRDGLGLDQDYKKAIEWYRKAAEAGNSDAMNELGLSYLTGKGVPENGVKAAKWYRKAAEAGNSNAMYELGQLYENGYGVPKNYKKAVEWVSKAAEAGNSEAMNNLGLSYRDGKGVSKDGEKAVEWLSKAAEAGDSYAMCNLGIGYRDGKEVPKDDEKAVEWLSKAAKAGSSWAMKELEASYLGKKGGKTRKYKFSGEPVFPIEDNTILENVRFLITNYEIEEADAIGKIGQQLANKSMSFVVISPKFRDSVIREITKAFENIEHGDIGAACFLAGESDLETLQDIAVVTGGDLIGEELGMSLKNIAISELGTSERICIGATCLEITGGEGKTNAVQGLAESAMCKIKNTADHDKKARLISRYENLTGQSLQEWPEYEPYQEKSLDGWRLPYGYASADLCNVVEPLRVELAQCCVLASVRPVCIFAKSEDNVVPLLEQVKKEALPLLLIAPCIKKEALMTLVINNRYSNLRCAAINTCGDIQIIEKMRQDLGIKIIDKTQKLSKVSLAELSVIKKVVILDDLSIFQL